MLGLIISETELLKTRPYHPFNFAVTKIHVAIFSVEDGTRMVGIQFQLSPSIIMLVVN